MSIGFDSVKGLKADRLYSDQVDQLRASGAKLCEYTELAVDSAIRSKRVLASLIHVAYLYAHRMSGFTDLLIEVNPRHVRFYKHMFGFLQLGPERLHEGVGAAAVLLHLPYAYSTDQIARAQSGERTADRSMYAYSFSTVEEADIVKRLEKLL